MAKGLPGPLVSLPRSEGASPRQAAQDLHEVLRCELLLDGDHPYRDAKPIVREAFDAFGPDRMIWGGPVGKTMEDFEKAIEAFEMFFNHATEVDKAKIPGSTAMKLFGC